MERSYRWLFWLLVVVGLTLDQAGKYGVYSALDLTSDIGTPPMARTIVEGNEQIPLLVKSWPETPNGIMELQTSFLADQTLPDGRKPPYVNRGALFGLGSEHGGLSNLLFGIVSVAAAVGIIFWTTRKTVAKDWPLCTSLGLILAGTLGNMYDRFMFGGVRDFLHFYWFEWPVFNFADCCLVCGAILLLVQAFLSKPEPAATPAPAVSQSV